MFVIQTLPHLLSFLLSTYLKKMVSIMDTYESDDNRNILLRKLWKSCV